MSGRVRDPLPLTAAVAVLSTAAVLLAAGYGWLGPDVDRGANFCEASGDGWLLQPVSSLSNLGFVLAGLLVALRARRPGGLGVGTLARHPAVATSYAVVVVLLGPGSMAMHATESEVGGWLDMASMYLLAGFVVAYAAMRLTGRGTGFFLALYAALVAACLALESIARPLPVIGHSGNLVFAVLLLTGLALEVVLARRGRGCRPALGAGLGGCAVAGLRGLARAPRTAAPGATRGRGSRATACGTCCARSRRTACSGPGPASTDRPRAASSWTSATC